MLEMPKIGSRAAEPVVSGWEGLRSLQVVEAVAEAARTRETVRLEPLV